jgi:hypothetical protein
MLWDQNFNDFNPFLNKDDTLFSSLIKQIILQGKIQDFLGGQLHTGIF